MGAKPTLANGEELRALLANFTFKPFKTVFTDCPKEFNIEE
jgi:hypothetical protein